MKGRKAKPTLQKILDGNPGKKAINRREPRPKSIRDNRPPAQLGMIGKALWRRTLKAMPPGVITAVDRELLEMYCMHYELLRLARREWRNNGSRFTLKGERGTQSNPVLRDIRQHSLIVARLASELGLSPTARTRLEMPQPPGMIGGNQNRDPFFDKGLAKIVGIQ